MGMVAKGEIDKLMFLPIVKNLNLTRRQIEELIWYVAEEEARDYVPMDGRDITIKLGLSFETWIKYKNDIHSFFKKLWEVVIKM